MLDDLLGRDFGRHATDTAAYAADLRDAMDEAGSSNLVRYVQTVVHTFGEHLSDWEAARRIAGETLGARTPTAETGKAWGHWSVACLLAGDIAGAAEAELAWFAAAGGDFRSAALELKCLLVSALVGSGQAGEARSVYVSVLGLARSIGPAAPHGAIGQVSGALATELLEAPSRTPEEVDVMSIAAEASYEAAVAEGGWYPEMCACYLKALVANVRGEPDAAMAEVGRARALIAANEPSPVDEAFLHLADAHACALAGEPEASARELAASDAIVAGWDKPGLLQWHAEERARVFPNLPPRMAAASPVNSPAL